LPKSLSNDQLNEEYMTAVDENEQMEEGSQRVS